MKPESNYKPIKNEPDIVPTAGGSQLAKNNLVSPNYKNANSGWKIGSDGTIEINQTLRVSNTLESTNFRKLIQEPNSGVAIWLSDGTTPNGNLNGTKGDICLWSSATGQIAYNTDSGTTWTLL